jgi:hypothetical protein
LAPWFWQGSPISNIPCRVFPLKLAKRLSRISWIVQK